VSEIAAHTTTTLAWQQHVPRPPLPQQRRRREWRGYRPRSCTSQGSGWDRPWGTRAASAWATTARRSSTWPRSG